MNIPKKAVLAAICFILLVFSGAPNAKAAAVDDAVEIFKECPVYSFNMDSIKDDHIIVKFRYVQIRLIQKIKLELTQQRIMLKMFKVRNIPIKSPYLFSGKMVANYMPEYVRMEKSKQ